LSRRPRRDISGVLILDKPLGISSNAALQKVRWLYAADKAGHTGSLDPLATGVLPVCLGESTKFSSHLLDADKTYEVEARMGISTSSGDAEGDVTGTASFTHVDQASVLGVLPRFTGRIQQVPPMYSALKHQGQPLYKLARKGEEIERKPREIEIYSLELTHFGENAFKLAVRCSKGTYIRTLVEDICQALGTVGHVSLLRRTQAGPFTLTQAVTLEQLGTLAQEGTEPLDALLLPVDTCVAHWPARVLDASSARRFLMGQAVKCAVAPGPARILGPDNEFLGVGEVGADQRLEPRRLLKTPSIDGKT
jgi:tRNA pseudouridine55 synthase